MTPAPLSPPRRTMTKFRICKFVDGNGKEWYQIQQKGWIFWNNIYSYGSFGHTGEIFKVDSIDEAKSSIKKLQKMINSNVVKKVECLYYCCNCGEMHSKMLDNLFDSCPCTELPTEEQSN